MKTFFAFLSLSLFLFSGCVPVSKAPETNQKEVIKEKLKNAQETSKDDNMEKKEENISAISSSSMFDQKGEPQKGDYVATVTTSMGDITIRLFTDKVPRTVENFVKHATDGYYNGVIFHRVIPGFMIQGGDPLGTGTGGESIYGGKFDDEFDSDLSNIRGSIAMANSGPNTNGSQFFINQADNTFLDFDKAPLTSKHAVFGQVISGIEVVDAIASVETGAQDRPKEDVKIEKIAVEKVE